MKILQEKSPAIALEKVPNGDLFRFTNSSELYLKTAYYYASKIKVVSIRNGEFVYCTPTRATYPVKSILVKY